MSTVYDVVEEKQHVEMINICVSGALGCNHDCHIEAKGLRNKNEDTCYYNKVEQGREERERGREELLAASGATPSLVSPGPAEARLCVMGSLGSCVPVNTTIERILNRKKVSLHSQGPVALDSRVFSDWKLVERCAAGMKKGGGSSDRFARLGNLARNGPRRLFVVRLNIRLRPP
nr:hypothetical protein Iba_chr11aCG9980 [Ipomoea batatas]